MTIATLTVNGTRPVLGSFGKALKGSVSLNFGRSGGKHCPSTCPYHPNSTSTNAAPNTARCYASTCETRPDRIQLKDKLERAEDCSGDTVCDVAYNEMTLRGWRVPWFRFSSFGSVPKVCTKKFKRLAKKLVDTNNPVHLPVYGQKQTKEYRTKLQGINIAVRQSVDINEFHSTDGCVSTVVGSMADDKPKERLRLAKLAAKSRTYHTGRKCIICPAIASTHNRTRSKTAKCGNCTACSNPHIDIVYPVHR